MQSVLLDTYAFIGMGTAVIEAGLCKVPSIVAIAYSDAPTTHGFIHDLDDYNSGEFIENHPTENVYDKLKMIFDKNEKDYQKICDESYMSLRSQYDINLLMKELLSKIAELENNQISYTKMRIPLYFIISRTRLQLISELKKMIKTIIKK